MKGEKYKNWNKKSSENENEMSEQVMMDDRLQSTAETGLLKKKQSEKEVPIASAEKRRE